MMMHKRLEGSFFKKKPNIRTHLNFIDLSLCKYVDSIYTLGQNRVRVIGAVSIDDTEALVAQFTLKNDKSMANIV